MNFEVIKKLLSIFDQKFKRKAVLLQIYLIIGVLFESVGLGMLVPLVNVFTDIDHANKNIFVRFVLNLTGNVSNTHLILWVLGSFVLFYLIKTLFLSFLIWKQTEFTTSISYNISSRLNRGYLFQPYAYFLDKNSAILMRNVQSEVNSVTGFVQNVMFVQTEISVLIGVVVTIFILEPYGAGVVFFFVGGVSYLLFSFSKRKISRWGKERQLYDGARSKNLLQGFTGVSELKLFSKEKYFADKFDSSTKSFFDIQRKVQFIQQVQRGYLEFVLIVSIALLSMVVLFRGNTIGTILPSLSIFLFAALRMLPSANRIITSLQAMHFTKAGVDLVCRELKSFGNEKPLPNTFPVGISSVNQAVTFHDISFTYPSAAIKSLDNINLEIKIGSVVGIIGQSGSGKTTLVNILTGLLEPTSGKVSVDGMDVTNRLYELRKFIGYVPQNIFLLDDSLKNNIAFGLPDSEIDLAQIHAVIKSAQLEEVVDNLPDGIDSIVGERGIKLSGGQRQRIGIARALYNNPSILILDEGTSALDNETETYVMSSVAKLKGKLTIILVAHRYTTLHFCDIVYKMQNGVIVNKGKLEELV